MYKDIDFIPEMIDKDTEIAIDTETTGLSPWRDRLALIQLYGNVTRTPVLVRIQDGVVPDIVCRLFEDKTMIGHNVSGFDILFLDNAGVPWHKAIWYDTLVGESVISTTSRRDVSKSLRESVRRRTGKVIDKSIEHGNWLAAQLSEQQITYAIEDVIYLHDLKAAQMQRASEQGQMGAMQLEQSLAPIVARMTLNGLPLKRSVMEAWLDEQSKLKDKSEQEIYQMLGKINLQSPQQIHRALADLGVQFPDTRAETLADYAQSLDDTVRKIAQLLLDYRRPAQVLKMYNETWRNMHIIHDWVHPRFWQVGADTYRFSSSNPNVQQIPKTSRHIIGNMEGYRIVSADYSQIEVRIAAYIAQDHAMMSALQEDDVHSAVASAVYGIPRDQVTKELRQNAKAMTFTLLFGGGATSLYVHAKNSGVKITVKDAENMVVKFFETYPQLLRIRKAAQALAANRRAVTVTLPHGGKRVLVGDKLRATTILNTTIQGGAACGLKYSLLEAHSRGLTKYIGAVVHDEIVAAVPEAEATDFEHELKEVMTIGMQKIYPTCIKVSSSNNTYWE